MARGNLTNRDILPFPTEFTIRNLQQDKDAIRSSLVKILQPLGMDCKWDEPSNAVLCLTKGDVWSRAARRKKARRSAQADVMHEDEDVSFVVRVIVLHADGEVLVRWLRGQDRVLLESFCGMLKRELCNRCPGDEMSQKQDL